MVSVEMLEQVSWQDLTSKVTFSFEVSGNSLQELSERAHDAASMLFGNQIFDLSLTVKTGPAMFGQDIWVAGVYAVAS